MLKMHELRELIRLIDQSSIHKFELESEGTKIVLKKAKGRVAPEAYVDSDAAPVMEEKPAAAPPEAPKAAPAPKAVEAAPAPAVEAPADTANLHKIVSPMVGTFYSAPSPDAKPYVSAGDTITEKSVVCIVEAMKLMNEIEAEVKGQVVQVLVENGQLVEYGQPLFLVKTT